MCNFYAVLRPKRNKWKQKRRFERLAALVHGCANSSFGQYILFVNFSNYVYNFAERYGVEVQAKTRPMLSATAKTTLPLLILVWAAQGDHRDGFARPLCKSGFVSGKCGGLRKKTRLAIWYYPLRRFAAKAPATIICLPRFRRCRPLVCKSHIVHHPAGCPRLLDRHCTPPTAGWEHDEGV